MNQCPNCKKEVKDSDKICPHCGYDLTKSDLKKQQEENDDEQWDSEEWKDWNLQ